MRFDSNQQDLTTLSWVKPELDETLKQARHALEAYVEESQDPAQLRACVGYLHQVQGTLRMVELYGAAMVAEEMEQLGKAVVDEKVSDRDGSFALLMRGIVQLPDYLERLQSGHRDIPIVLLPLLNELRTARGEQVLPESVLFSPDLSLPLPKSAEGPAQPLSAEELKRRAGGLGGLFQSALLRWLKDDNSTNTVRDLTDVCDQLVPITHDESARRLFWVAGGTLDALSRGAFSADKQLKQVLAKVEREIKRLADQGDNAFRMDPPLDLTRQLLYFVAHAPTDQGRIAEIRSVFGLNALIPTEAELSHARGSMAGHNRALLATVANAIKEDLMRVKDTLDLFLRSPGSDPAGLAAQTDTLDRVGDTLGMLGLGVPRRVVQEQRNSLHAVSAGQKSADENTLLDIAGALLYVEATLDDQVERLGQGEIGHAVEDVNDGSNPMGFKPSLPVNESRAVLETLIKEASGNFAQVRQCFVAFVETHWDHSQLTDVPRLLEEVSGALNILEIKDAPQYLNAIRRFTENELLRRRRVPNGQQMDRLADALASVEYFLEAVRDRRAKRDIILDMTRNSLEALNYWPIPSEDTSAFVTPVPKIKPAEVAVTPVVAISAPAAVQAPVEPAIPVVSQAAAPLVQEPVALQPEPIVAPVLESKPEVVAPPVSVPALANAMAAGLSPLPGYDASTSEEIDDEIREVFLEEFQEEIGNLDQLLPPWRAAPDKAELLRPIRRVFHTLKGSGRLVGAKALGEFSWKIESMLNRVLDGTRVPTPAVIEIVDHAFNTLPLLRAALAGETVYADVDGMGAVAEKLAAGEEVRYSAPVLAAAAVDIPVGSSFQEPVLEEPVAEVEPAVAEVVKPVYTEEMPVETSVVDFAAVAADIAIEDAAAPAPEATTEAMVEGEEFSIDPVLFEILKPEVTGHLETVDAWVAKSRLEGPQTVNENLLRSVHTMNGAFAMTEVSAITDVLSPLEGFFKRASNLGIVPSIDNVETVAQAADAVRTTVLGLGQAQPRMPIFVELAAKTRNLRDALPEVSTSSLAVQNDGERDSAFMPQAVDLEAPDVSAIPEFAADEVLAQEEVFASEGEDFAIVDADAPVFADESSAVAIEEEVLAVEQPVVSSDPVIGEVQDSEPVEQAVSSEAAADDMLEKELLSLNDFLEEEPDAAPEQPAVVQRSDAELLAEFEGYRSTQESTRKAETPAALEPAVEIDPSAGDALAAMIAAFGDQGTAATVDTDAPAFADDAAFEVPMQSEEALPNIEEYYGLSEAELEALTAPESDAADKALAEKAEAERAAVEQAELQRIEAERAEAERSAAEAQRIEQQRIAAEQEAVRVEEQRQQAEREELERVAAERAEAARIENERRAAEAAELQRQRDEQARLAEQAAADVAAVSAVNVPQAQDAEDPDADLDMKDMDSELLDIFLEESTDLLDHSDSLLAGLREKPSDKEIIVGLQRDLHTLKGGARMAGIFPIGELGHSMESLLEAAADGKRSLDGVSVVVLERAFDRLHGMVDRVGARKAIAMPSNLIGQIDALALGKSIEAAGEITERPAAATALDRAAEKQDAAPAPVVLTPSVSSFRVSAPIEALTEDDDPSGVRAPQEMVRIRADLLDRLVNYAGEVAIYRARLEQQLGAFRSNLGELEQTTTRLREQLRRLEIETEAQITSRYQREQDAADPTFDPLELDRFSTQQQLTRALSESANDITNLQGSLDDLTRQYETLLLQQSRVSSDLQEGLMRTRMVPFDALVPRLRRVMRQASTDTGKQVQLKVDGAQGEMDRNVLERMTAPLEHMLRNSMAHGIESPQDRKKAGKAEEGTVRVAVSREGSEVVLKITDDGRGLNKQAIRSKAIERGLLDKDAEISDQELYSMILQTGFSTAEQVSRLAGRGVGMDVVYSEIRQLGGTLQIDSTEGKGSVFTVRLPFTLAVTQAVFVRIGETNFAVPIASVRGVGRVDRPELDKQLRSEDPKFRYAGEDYLIHDLGDLIGHGHAKAQDSLQMPLLLARAGDLRAAICVDEVLGSREIVVKPVGPQVNSIPGIFGATIMGDGRVVVILDVAPLVRRRAAMPREELQVAPVVIEKQRVPVVMVVDDSITMRKVTGRVLERHNMEVLTAKDGVDAIEKLAENVPDLMLLDIEMPRMDGYELATIMRGDSRLKDVPIIMITSRTGEKHRQRAMEIGVNRYLGKPYQENELMRNVFEMLGMEPVDG